MKLTFNYLLLFISSSILISCNDDITIANNTQQCDSTNTTFNQLYNNLASASTNQDEVTMDLESHTYTFEVLSNKTICKIGYQSLPTFNTTPYVIEIHDNTSNTPLYSGSHVFSSASTSYITINPTQVVTGHSYTIKRIQTNWNGNIVNTIGRLVNGNITFPVIHGDLKITGSSFYGTGGPSDDWGIPYIDIVFEN